MENEILKEEVQVEDLNPSDLIEGIGTVTFDVFRTLMKYADMDAARKDFIETYSEKCGDETAGSIFDAFVEGMSNIDETSIYIESIRENENAQAFVKDLIAKDSEESNKEE